MWQGITAVIGVIAGLIAIIGVIYRYGRMNARIEILWDAYKAEARSNTRRSGAMERGSKWHLTEKGEDLIPVKLKEEIKKLLAHKRGIKAFIQHKLNPGLDTWEVIEKLGGVERLCDEADTVGVSLKEMMVMVEAYIDRELEESRG